MVKIASFADMHLGYAAKKGLTNNQGINLRVADGYIAFHRLVSSIIDEGVDTVIIGGDTFHTPHPDVATIVYVQNEFRRFAKAGIPVYALAGNHDVSDVKADIAASRILHDPDRSIFSHIEPYVKYEIADGIMLHMVSHHMYSEQEKTMLQVKTDPGKINIFSTHGSVIDPITKMKLHTAQSPREVIIPDFLLDDQNWDYTILGHIHERGWVGNNEDSDNVSRNKIYYNGSLLRRGFSDKECTLGRGWTLWEISPDGSFSGTPKVIPERPQIDFEIIDGSELTPEQITEKIIENLVATQTDGEKFCKETAPILRQRLANLSSAKFSSLDKKAIDNASKHAFSFDLKQMLTVMDSPKHKNKNIEKDAFISGTDMIHAYDSWIDSSTVLKSTSESIRDKVQGQTRKFLELGQEKMLNE